MIVKVQMPLGGSATSEALVYDEKRSFLLFVPITDSLKDMMDDEVKKFFHAKKVGKELKLIKEAPWQEW